MLDRRVFLTSLTAGTGGLLLAKPAVAAPPDAVLTEIGRQLSQSLDKAVLTASDWKQKASALRMLAAYANDHQWEAKLRNAVRQAIRERGRDAIIALRPNAAELRRHAGDTARAIPLPLDVAAKGRALNQVLHDNFAQRLTIMGDVCDWISRQGVVPVQYNTWPYTFTTREQSCVWMGFNAWVLEVVTVVVCLVPVLNAACIPISVTYLINASLLYWGC
jgi:hypothetical protein